MLCTRIFDFTPLFYMSLSWDVLFENCGKFQITRCKVFKIILLKWSTQYWSQTIVSKSECQGLSIYDVWWFWLSFYTPPTSSYILLVPPKYKIRFDWTFLLPTIWSYVWATQQRVLLLYSLRLVHLVRWKYKNW